LGKGTTAIAEFLKYTLFMMLALNINAGISPGTECPTVEQPAPHPVVACGPALPSRPEGSRRGREHGEARIFLIDGEKK
jgi:hypothetical protein